MLANGVRVKNRACARDFARFRSIGPQRHAAKRQMVPLNARKARQRRAARAVQHPQERALGGERIAGVGVKDRRERGQRRRIVFARRDSNRALPDGGEKIVDVENSRRAIGQPKPLEAGQRQHGGVKLAFLDLAQAGLDIAAQQANLKVWPQSPDLGAAPQRRGADFGAVAKPGDRARAL